TPVPVQQQTTPRSASPRATASPTCLPTSGHGSSSTSTTTSCPRARSDSMTEAVSSVRSSVPKAILTTTRLRTYVALDRGPHGRHRSAHPLGPGVVPAVPAVPAQARRAARRAVAPAGGGPVLCPLPARRADGGHRRLPRAATPGRGAAAPAGRHGPAGRGAVVRAHGRVLRVGRDDRPRPSALARDGCRLRR